MIDVEDLTYTYPGADAETIRGIDFAIEEAEVFGFLGPSGAGKSTTQKILVGLLSRYEGGVEIMGREVADWGREFYEHVGVSFEAPNHHLKLTARENLAYFGALYAGETRDTIDVLEWVGLADDADKKVADFSKGMKGRLNVARSLLHRPKLLFLDEPTAGLDPVNARNIKDLVLGLADEGTTVFVTTHNMMVADQLCDRVGFIVDGRLELVEGPDSLKRRFGERSVSVEYLDGSETIARREFPIDGLGDNDDFIETLRRASRIETIHTQETTLEQIFIEVTGRELDP